MSRKKTQPKKVVTPDPIFKSTIIPKLINSIMYDGKKVVAAKIIYGAIEKIKSKTKEEPINVFNEAINNIKPTVEVRSRRVGGATYQVPVEVKNKRAQALAIRWLVDASRKRKDKKINSNCVYLWFQTDFKGAFDEPPRHRRNGQSGPDLHPALSRRTNRR